MADVFGARVFQLSVGNSAALGAALRAAHAHLRERDRATEWDDVVAGLAEPLTGSGVEPDPDRHALYREMMPVYAACEAHALGRGPNPSELVEQFARFAQFAQNRPRDAARA
jgi:sugar (pentulose or hexulose) kinase